MILVPTTPRQSRRVGPARDADGQRVTAFEALVALACARCGRPIRTGELFTRQTHQGRSGISYYNLGLVTVCMTCRPVQLGNGDSSCG